MDYQAERLGLIVDLAEQSMDIVQRFSNDPIGAGNIQTASGPIKNLKQVSADIKSDGQSAIDVAVTELIDTLKTDTSVSALIEGLTDTAALAEENAGRAVVAADSANAMGKIYATPALGLAATAVGLYFSVPSPDSAELLILYQNVDGIPTERKRYPSAGLIREIDLRVSQDYYMTDALMQFVDGDEQSLGHVNKDAGWDILLSTIKTVDGLSIYEYEAMGAGYSAVLVDANNKIIATFGGEGLPESDVSAEVKAARGNRVDLTARLAENLNAYGLPKHHTWGEWFLRETRQRLRKRALGESAKLTIAAIGDSWTHSRDRYSGPMAASFKADYGNAGPGWTGFAWGFGGLSSAWSGGNGNASSAISVALTANWTVNYYTTPSPDLGSVITSIAGSKVTVTCSEVGVTSAKLFYMAGTAGEFRYRFNGGAWTTVTVGTSAAQEVLSLAGVPAIAWTLEVEHVAGTVTLCGADLGNANDGVRLHKLGATGSNAGHWTAVDEAQWAAGLKALAPNLVTILLATNDQPLGPIVFRTKVQALISRAKGALPLADILLIAPCENGRANTYPMTGFAAAMYELAAQNNCAFLDLQYVFGNQFSEYASTSPRNWFNADLIHPEPSTGGRVILDALVRLLTKA